MARMNIMNQIKGPSAPTSLAESRRAQQRQLMNQQVAAAPVAPGSGILGPDAAAQVGQQAAQQAGAIRSEEIQQAGQSATAQGQQAVQRQAIETQRDEEVRSLGLAKKQHDLEMSFAKLARDKKAELYDKAMEFQLNEQGRVYLNEIQLMDYQLAKGISEEEWANYQQEVTQAASREIQLMEAAFRKLEQEMSQESFKKRTDIANETKLELAQAKADLEREIQRKKAKAANRASMFSSIGTLAGAGIGAFAGTILMPGAGTLAGAQAGAAVGGGVGSMAATF